MKNLYLTMVQKPSLFLMIFAITMLLSRVSSAQMLADFETAQTTPTFTAEGTTAVVDNPDKTGINTSDKVGYYQKISGNWHYVTMTYTSPMPIGTNNTLTFKIHASQKGRIFAKFWIGNAVLIESWAPVYGFMPTPGEWVECTMDLTPAMGTTFDKLELAACVDNNAVAEVYFDDVKLSNPDVGDGSPKVFLSAKPTNITVGDTVTFDASASYDIDGQITGYSWDFGDGQTETGVSVKHKYTASGAFTAKLTVTDNENKSKTDSTYIFVFDGNTGVSDIIITTPNPATNQKIEGLFQMSKSYSNVFDPDEVQVDAIVTKPSGQTLTVPCFYYVRGYLAKTEWKVDSSYQGWMVRFSTNETGNHTVKLVINDADGEIETAVQTVSVTASDSKGVVQLDAANKQYYRHKTGEAFYPLGINYGWGEIAEYTKTIKALSSGKANIYRYWHTPFARQALEWKDDNNYDGLGHYNQKAAAMTDSLIDLSEATDVLMQLVIFQHGMFSENVNPMWADNPYNKLNGGYVERAEEYFYNDDCKVQTRKLLRYIVARWGYSSQIFAWEFFNEVQFTGIHNSQSAKWFPGVLTWHSEMSRYVDSIDPYNHIMTTSAEHDQLPKLDTVLMLDNLQYHLYSANLLTDQVLHDEQFKEELTNASIINGEYGTDVEAQVSFDQQRHSIWNGIMTQVPRYMWLWETYSDPTWANLFRMPSAYMADEEFATQLDLVTTPFKVSHPSMTLISNGMSSGKNNYAYIYDASNNLNIENVEVTMPSIPLGVYDITYYLPEAGTTVEQKNVPLITLTTKLKLPKFSKGMAIKVIYVADYTLPIALAPNDTVVAPGTPLVFSGSQSQGVQDKPLSYNWQLIQKPETSTAILTGATTVEASLTPDVSGIYKITLVVTEDGVQSVADTVQITVSNVPIAIIENDKVASATERYCYISGSASYDPDNDPITYHWELFSAPEGSRKQMYDIDKDTSRLRTDVLGEYIVTLKVHDGVSFSNTDTVKINVTPTGIEQLPVGNIKVYPNPASQNLFIVSQTDAIQSIEVYDLSGKLVIKKLVSHVSQTSLNLSELNLSSGLILVKVNTDKGYSVHQITLLNH